MKKLLTLLALMLVCVGQAFAYDFEVDGIYYRSCGYTLGVCPMSDNCGPDYQSYSGDVIIPSTVYFQGEIYSVTSIEPNAFYACEGVTSVKIPNSVTSIGYGAFHGCRSLTSVNIPEGVTRIESHTFSDCALTSITIPNSVINIEDYAFSQCENLTSVTIPISVQSIGEDVFSNCSGLTSINVVEGNPNYDSRDNCNAIIETASNTLIRGCKNTIIPNSVTSIGEGAFDYCSGLTSVTIPNSVTSIGNSAFWGCSGLTSANISEGVTSIGNFAFWGCSGLTSITIPNSVTDIGGCAFGHCNNSVAFLFFSPTPPNIKTNTFEKPTIFVINDAYNTYKESWTAFADKIYPMSIYDCKINVNARDVESAIHRAIGEENLTLVRKLKITGSINGYDIMVMRNKMINLRHLDLSEATIVGNDYEYYTGYHTSDDEIGPFAFYNLPNLISVKLPDVTAIGEYAFANCTNLQKVKMSDVTAIGQYAFENCKNLYEINLPESLTTLSNYAFSHCSALPSIEIPGSVASIGSYAFYRCPALTQVNLHEGLNRIGRAAFSGCAINEICFPESLLVIDEYAFAYDGYPFPYNEFEELNLPPNLSTIGQYAFEGCYRIHVVRLNPMLKSIADNAFSGCNNLNKVYTYIVEPTNINQNTFSTYKTADLYVPTPSYYTYFYDTQWSQFLSVNPTDEEYDFKSFYINKDYVMDDDSGILGGEPDAELNENSGLVNESSETQELGTVKMRFNGNNGSASIIANGNLTAEKINVEITVTGNKWHFFCFPFDVPLSGVSVSGNKAYVFRHYNAAKRATGASGWEELPADQTVLKAGEGYIFQANGNSTLTVTVDNKTTFVGENVAAALQVQDASNVANASWNFKGNPGYAYFDIDDLGFTAPITVWDPNTNSYVALRPGDDDAFLHPFQAFFVQKPEGTDALTFNAEDRTTYLGSQKKMKNKVERRRLAAKADSPRKLINLSVTDGTNTDKTRIVFNDEKSMAYEMDCDAAKFAATGVPQLYSLDDANNKYAINERPNGDGTVRLGFTADKSGHFTIEAPRMDTPCYLRDLVKGTTHDFTVGAYEFDSEKGDFNNRFVLVNTIVAEGIETIDINDIAAGAVIYDLQGRRMPNAERGLCIINGKKVNVK